MQFSFWSRLSSSFESKSLMERDLILKQSFLYSKQKMDNSAPSSHCTNRPVPTNGNKRISATPVGVGWHFIEHIELSMP